MRKILVPFSLIYFPLTISVGLIWLQGDGFGSLLSFALWQLIMAKIVYDLVWLSIAWLSPVEHIPKVAELRHYPSVGLLYVCRDDIVVDCAQELAHQDYPNFDVFILDDSQIARNIELVDQIAAQIRPILKNDAKVIVVRRADLSGYKAGNLNNWLKQYGDRYDYFVIFDNDSKADPNFIGEVVRYAEHPKNRQIAIFQSKIFPWNQHENYFVRFIGATAPLYMYLLDKLGNQTGTVISFGHNNLHRTKPVLEIGGFNVDLTSEDTTITLELDANQYHTAVVDVLSYEAEPSNLAKYRRRAIRWAGQTAALFHYPWEKTSWALKFELSRQLIYYLINLIFFVWLLSSIWYVADKSSLGDLYHQVLSLIKFYETPYIITFGLVSGLLCLHFLLHILLARKSGVKLRYYAGHIVTSMAVYFYTTLPVSIAFLKAIFGQRVIFKPSNLSLANSSLREVIAPMALLWGTGSIAMAQYFWFGKNPWEYLGGWWAMAIWMTPFLLYIVQHYPSRSD